jgi:TPR repeat protein
MHYLTLYMSLYKQACSLYDSKEYDESIKTFVNFLKDRKEIDEIHLDCMIKMCLILQNDGLSNNILPWLNNQIEDKNSIAIWVLGDIYYYGHIVKENNEEAVKLYRESAKYNDVYAQYNLGIVHYSGLGIEKDTREAIKWYSKSAEQGYAEAQCELGKIYYNDDVVEEDFDAAIKYFTKSAGLTVSQYYLGLMYCKGYGTARNYKKALEHYIKSAEQNDPDAIKALGNMYWKGKGVTKDLNIALEWYKKGYEIDNDKFSCLGEIYEEMEDFVKAGTFYVNIMEDDDFQRVFQKTDHKDPYLQYYMGCLNCDEDTYHIAFDWFNKSAEQGNDYGQNELGELYRDGNGCDANDNLAIKLFKKSAKQNNSDGQYNLGCMYQKGTGVKKDLNKAMEWIILSANNGNTNATEFLESDTKIFTAKDYLQQYTKIVRLKFMNIMCLTDIPEDISYLIGTYI